MKNKHNIKRFLNKNLPLITAISVTIIILLIYIFVPSDISSLIFSAIFGISIIAFIIVEILSKKREKTFNIKDKKSTLKLLDNIFSIDKVQTIKIINTKEVSLKDKTKESFKDSREVKNKHNIYSIFIPSATTKDIINYLDNNDPDELIIHIFNTSTGPHRVTRSVSICIASKLHIIFSKDSYSKEEIKEITTKLNELSQNK